MREREGGERTFKLMYYCSCYNSLFEIVVSGLNFKKAT